VRVGRVILQTRPTRRKERALSMVGRDKSSGEDDSTAAREGEAIEMDFGGGAMRNPMIVVEESKGEHGYTSPLG
jgi:hypothetical protein